MKKLCMLCCLAALPATNGWTQERDFEDGYDGNLLYVHATANYAWDLESQFDWERRQFAGNALRVNTGSVSSDRLFTDIQLNLNGQLNDRWRLSGRFFRLGARTLPITTEQLLIGFEGFVSARQAFFVTVNPEYDKSALDLAVGYGWYSDNRERYLRAAVLLDDMNFSTKNDFGGRQTQDAVALDWQLRLPVGGGWFVYSEGRWGSGYERAFDDAELSPELFFEEQRNNRAELRLSHSDGQGAFWSVWTELTDFDETRRFRDASRSYRYENAEVRLAAERVWRVGERHRWRVLATFVDRNADATGAGAHRLDRRDVTGGVFYEFLWPNSAVSAAYVAGLPDIVYVAPNPADSYDVGDYADKLVFGWRYRFSQAAQVRASLSHEVSVSGFGGGAVQFEWFF